MTSPKRAGKLSPRLKKPFSPAARDPRFSRRTPDKLLAAIESARPAKTIGDAKTWLGRIIAGKARKLPIYDKERATLLSKLEKIAADGALKDAKIHSPAPDSYPAGQEMTGNPVPRSRSCLVPAAPAGLASPGSPVVARPQF